MVTHYVATGVIDHAYYLTDHLGSIDTITDQSGAVIERMSFDAWGKRRQTDWVPIPDPAGYLSLTTSRGYTGHEELDPVGLVHMNGRVYDPEIGRFVSADPVIQFPFNLQNLNRYSYVLNNPLSFTDPEGLYAYNPITGTDPYASGSTSSSSTTAMGTTTIPAFDTSDDELEKMLGGSSTEVTNGTPVSPTKTVTKTGDEVENPSVDSPTQEEILVAQAGYDYCRYNCESTRILSPNMGEGFIMVPGRADAVGGGFQPLDAGMLGLGAGIILGIGIHRSLDVGPGEALIPEVQHGPTILNSESPQNEVEGCIYCVKGENTKSGKDYIGATDDIQTRRHDKSDGRNRENAEPIGSYPKGDRAARRAKEQQAINDRGGVDNVDNRRNEVAPKYWESMGITPPRP